MPTPTPGSSAKSPRPFHGMMPIMATAIAPDGEIDETSQRRLVEYCLKCGAVAVGHFGFASEFQKLSEKQRSQLLETIISAVDGRAPVFIGVTGPSTYVSAAYAREAEARGANLLMAGLPYVNIPGRDGALDFYKRLADVSALPIIVQEVPASSEALSVELLCTMFEEIGQVQYVKVEGSGFLTKSHALIEATEGRLPVIGGAGGRHMLHLLRLGVTAFMTGTEALDLHAAAVHAYLGGDEAKAAEVYYQRILPYLMFYTEHSKELLKGMLHARGIIDCAAPISPAPGPAMSPIERREFEWVLGQIGFRKTWPDIP